MKHQPEHMTPSMRREQRRKIRVKRMLFLYTSQCMWCGKWLDWDSATLEHIVPRSKGGRTVFSNCGLACASCNHRRHDRDGTERPHNVNGTRRRAMEQISLYQGSRRKRTAKVLIRSYGIYYRDGAWGCDYLNLMPKPETPCRPTATT